MTFIWPSMLYALLAIPIIIALYLLAQRRRRTLSNRFPGFSSGQKSARQPPGLRRHLPSLCFLLGLTLILVALARPQARMSVPRVEGTVILVFDVSASMGADDVEPSRLEAAKASAREFVLSQPSTVRVGIVSFSGSGFAVQTPTNDTHSLLSTIARLQPTSGTSLGQGILTALNTIAVDAGLTKDEPTAATIPATAEPSGQNPPQASPPGRDPLAQLPDGIYPVSAIVLLSDGENNQSIDPLEAAQAAADRMVPIHALGFGTSAGTTLEVDGYRVHTALDEATLLEITQSAFGSYFAAQGDQDPKQVYASLTPRMVLKRELMELTAVFAGASIVVMLAGSLLSTLWFGRLL